jgi:multiple stress resistance protein BhsA
MVNDLQIHLLKVNIMKNVKTLIAAAVLSSLSFASFAAVQVQSTPADQHKVGTISASAGTNLGSLEDQLAQKAQEMGAKSYRITSVTGPNTLHGTAVIYK